MSRGASSAGGAGSLTMSAVVDGAGIGRATLYRYFADIDTLLSAWHEREIERHLAQLAEARERSSGARERLVAVLATYAAVARQADRPPVLDISEALHRRTHVADARRRLHELVKDVLEGAASAGAIRADVPADELATYCIHALSAARSLDSSTSVERLVELTLAGLAVPARRPQRGPGHVTPPSSDR